MADKKKNVSADKAGEKSKKSENFFVKIWKKLVKLCKDNSVRDENGDLRGFYIGNEPIESLLKALERFSAGVGSFLFYGLFLCRTARRF